MRLGMGLAVALVLVGCGEDAGTQGTTGSGGTAGGGGIGGEGGAGTGGAGTGGGTGGSGVCGTIEKVSAGKSHTCVLCDGGKVACWGLDVSGELGRGVASSSTSTPGLVTVIDVASDVVAGWSQTCVLTGSGEMWCWGDNAEGQLGDGSVGGDSLVAVKVAGLSGVDAMAAGGNRTCAVAGGEVFCWGDNQFRQLGNGSSDDSPTPVQVSTLTGVEELDLSQFSHHACARSAESVSCWGYNASGQLGASTPGGFADAPVSAAGISDAISIATGELHTCVAHAGGTVSCFGAAPLGNGTPMPLSVPIGGVTRVVAGTDFSCALLDDKTVKCWGENARGQLGDGTTADSDVPVTVGGLADVVAIDAGGGHTCALTQSRDLYCWGDGEFGQTGVDAMATSTPVQVDP